MMRSELFHNTELGYDWFYSQWLFYYKDMKLHIIKWNYSESVL